jgi:hypothetical protein
MRTREQAERAKRATCQPDEGRAWERTGDSKGARAAQYA